MMDEIAWGLDEMARNGDDQPLLDTGSAPTIFASGAEVELADGLAHLIFWEHVHGVGLPGRRVVARVPMTADAARTFGSRLRKKLPTKSH